MADISTNISNLAADLRDFRTKLTNAGIAVSSTAGFRECVDALRFNGTNLMLPYYLTRVDQLEFGANTTDNAYVDYEPFITGGEHGSSYYSAFGWQDEHVSYNLSFNHFESGFYDICTKDGLDSMSFTVGIRRSDFEEEEEIVAPYGGNHDIPRIYIDKYKRALVANDYETCRLSTNPEDFTIELFTDISRPADNSTVEFWIKESVYFKALNTKYSPTDLSNVYRYIKDSKTLQKIDWSNIGCLVKKTIVGSNATEDSRYKYALDMNIQYLGNEFNEDYYDQYLYLVDFSSTSLNIGVKKNDLSVHFDNSLGSSTTLYNTDLPDNAMSYIQKRTVLNIE